MYKFEIKHPQNSIGNYSITIQKVLSPEIKHSIYRKYKNLAHSPEGIRIETSAFLTTKSSLIGRDGASSDFNVDKKLFKLCGVTAEDVDVDIRFISKIQLRTPKLVTQKWKNVQDTETIDRILLVNPMFIAEVDGKIVWSFILQNPSEKSRVLYQLLMLIKGYRKTLLSTLANLTIKVKPVSIFPHLPTLLPTSNMSIPEDTILYQNLIGCESGNN